MRAAVPRVTFCFGRRRAGDSAYGGAVQTTIPYGSWPSPLTAAAVSGAAPRIEGARFVGDDIWWGVTVPEEGGRTAVRRRALRPGEGVEPVDVLPAPWNARSRVHESQQAGGNNTDRSPVIAGSRIQRRLRCQP